MEIGYLLNEYKGRTKCAGEGCNHTAAAKKKFCIRCEAINNVRRPSIKAICKNTGAVETDRGFRYQLKTKGRVRRLCVGENNTCKNISAAGALCHKHKMEYLRTMPPRKYIVVNEFVKLVVMENDVIRGCVKDGCYNPAAGHGKYCNEHY